MAGFPGRLVTITVLATGNNPPKPTRTRVLTEYLLHYNEARPHRSLGQLTAAQADSRPPEPINLAEFRIRRKQALGGLAHEYYAAACLPRGTPESCSRASQGELHHLLVLVGLA